MAVTQKRRNVVKNPGRLSPAQKKAGFGGKRAMAAAKSKKRHKPAAKAKAKPVRKNKARSAPKAKAHASHRPRTKPRARKNTGKILSFLLPKESTPVATTKKNRSRKNKSSYHHKPKTNSAKRRATQKNPSVGDIGPLVSSAVFVIAGAVGSKYATQMALGASNTGVMGYFGNLVSAFVLSWGVKSFMKNEKAAAAVLSGGIVQVVLRLINDYTPFGQFTANIGMGDAGCAGMNAYMLQNFVTPQRLVDGMHSAQLQTFGGGLSGCGNLYSNKGGLYSNAA